jgi:hypothetical protein
LQRQGPADSSGSSGEDQGLTFELTHGIHLPMMDSSTRRWRARLS